MIPKTTIQKAGVNMFELSPRQIHLDFHTSEHILDIAADFDAGSFSKTIKEANISSVTVFARCHHGWMYYPSKKYPERIHPNLQKPELMLEQVKALHKAGVRAPVYITVQWDYQSATTHPDWLVRKKDGSHEGPPFTEPGFYQSLCVNTTYYDFLAAHTAEVCELLGDELDGVFFDIVSIRPCWCASCRAEMKEKGIDASDDDAVRRFAKFVLDRFKENLSKLVRLYNKKCSIFYNAGHIGPCTKESREWYTHLELESLPSGSWGYLHFPVTAKYARTLGMDCMGMTGKFHTSWGDYHSLKNLAALEFECFRMLSYGFACSIGDQMEPCGVLNPATYKLIGKVYGQYAAMEEWARPSKALTEAALVTSEKSFVESCIPETVLGAVQMLDELALQYDVIDMDMELGSYKLIILPDDLAVNEDFQQKLDIYVKGGGCVISCSKGGLAKCTGDGNAQYWKYPECFGTDYAGEAERFPDFIIAEGELGKGLESGNEYVIYYRGVKVVPAGAEAVLNARAPYFNREKEWFCSHEYTPSAKGEVYPVGLRNGRVIMFSHPIFGQYRSNAPAWCKQFISNAIDLLLPSRLIRHNGPSTMTVSLLDQQQHNRVNVHILSYIPVRKSVTIDIIEERTKVCQVVLDLNLPYEIKSARLIPQNRELRIENGKVMIPEVDGYSIVELRY